MSATSNPFGLRPAFSQTGVRMSPRCMQNGIASAYATALYQYTPVALNSSGNIVVAVVGANDFIGCFDGIEYTDSNGRRQYSKYWPASLAPLAGTTWNVYVFDDPSFIYEIQCNGALGTVAAPYVGGQIDLINPGTGNATTQLSSCAADTANISTSAQKQLRVLDKGRYVDNDWGDTYTIIQVQIARHQYVSNKVAV